MSNQHNPIPSELRAVLEEIMIAGRDLTRTDEELKALIQKTHELRKKALKESAEYREYIESKRRTRAEQRKNNIAEKAEKIKAETEKYLQGFDIPVGGALRHQRSRTTRGR